MKYVLDSSFLISLYKSTDSNHKEARITMYTMEDEDKIIIPYIAAAEFLVYASDISKAIQFCKGISGHLEPSLQSDLEFYQNITLPKRKTLKANDCLILATCKRMNAHLITFDKKLEKLSNII